MSVIKDYFGHEIHKGDVVLYNEKASKGYRSSFTEGVVIGFNTLNTVSVTGYEYLEEFKTGGYNYLMYRKYKEKKKCVCGCTEFTGDDVAMNLKYFGRDVKTLLCRGCFQNIMEMTDKQWDEAIDGFKAQGCELF